MTADWRSKGPIGWDGFELKPIQIEVAERVLIVISQPFAIVDTLLVLTITLVGFAGGTVESYMLTISTLPLMSRISSWLVLLAALAASSCT